MIIAGVVFCILCHAECSCKYFAHRENDYFSLNSGIMLYCKHINKMLNAPIFIKHNYFYLRPFASILPNRTGDLLCMNMVNIFQRQSGPVVDATAIISDLSGMPVVAEAESFSITYK